MAIIDPAIDDADDDARLPIVWSQAAGAPIVVSPQSPASV